MQKCSETFYDTMLFINTFLSFRLAYIRLLETCILVVNPNTLFDKGATKRTPVLRNRRGLQTSGTSKAEREVAARQQGVGDTFHQANTARLPRRDGVPLGVDRRVLVMVGLGVDVVIAGRLERETQRHGRHRGPG